MAKAVRQVIKIYEEKCNGCGQCVPSCAEGAIKIIDGKARLVAEKYCDGLGACLGECPMGALSFEEREAEDFDEQATVQHLENIGVSPEAHFKHMEEHGLPHSGDKSEKVASGSGCSGGKHGGFVCPSAKMLDRTKGFLKDDEPEQKEQIKSELRQWPTKLYLVNPTAPYFQDADLLVAADCTPFAYGGLHPDFLKGRVVVTGCPKFDDTAVYFEKLSNIMKLNNIKSVTVLQMEVPCCSGMRRLTDAAIVASGKNIPIETVTISLTGEVLDKKTSLV